MLGAGQTIRIHKEPVSGLEAESDLIEARAPQDANGQPTLADSLHLAGVPKNERRRMACLHEASPAFFGAQLAYDHGEVGQVLGPVVVEHPRIHFQAGRPLDLQTAK